MSDPEPSHDELEALLRAAVARRDGPPAEVVELCHGLWDWRDPDAEMAALVADSRELTGAVRGGQDETVLRFEAGGTTIVVQAQPGTDGAGGLMVLGRVEVASGAGTVSLRRTYGSLDVPCDELGRFRAEGVAPGPLSLRWAPDAGPAVVTEWTLLS